MDMGLAAAWLALHIFGVFVALALLVIVCRKEDTNYKCELVLAFSCCLVTLVAKSFYIMGGDEETLLALGKLEYLGKCFANYCALMFLLRWKNGKVSQWFITGLLSIKYRVLYADRFGALPDDSSFTAASRHLKR